MKLPWPRRSSPAREEEAPTASLPQVRLFLPDTDLSGWVEAADERLSDRLHAGTPLRFLPATADEWLAIEPSDLLIVVPPPYVSPLHLRMRRQQHDVFVRLARYVVTGTAHLMPGEEYDPYLRSTRQFLPLSEATVAIGDEPPESYEAVIVNLKRVDEFRVL